MKALVIVGHGSHLNEDSSLPVYEHAARIRERFGDEYDEVVECFWKEEPSMRHVLDMVEAQDVYVVPAFISEGYFTQQVIPRELGLEGEVTKKGDKTVRYAGPLGTFEGMPDVILERVEDLMRGRQTRGRTALVLLGHGTDLNKNSGGVIYLNASRIRERGLTGEETHLEGKRVFYGAPVGTHPSMANLIVARARETEKREASGVV